MLLCDVCQPLEIPSRNCVVSLLRGSYYMANAQEHFSRSIDVDVDCEIFSFANGLLNSIPVCRHSAQEHPFYFEETSH